jgi:pyridoxine kinase
MALALILSSHVAASRVGGFAQALALAQFKVDAVLAPTVLYGRHPGWGPPGGAEAPAEVFESVLDGIDANGLFGMTDVVITGYFANAAQVRAAGRAIDAVRAAPREGAYTKKPKVIVDPTFGDAGKGLYVPVEVADAIQSDLIPRADIIRANSWEIERLTGAPAREPVEAMKAARLLVKPVLVSSVSRRDEIGVVYADKAEAWFAAHQKLQSAPNGTGDLLTALFAACVIEGQPVNYALARSVGGLVETITAAHTWDSPELPIVAVGARVKLTSPMVRIERLG